MSQPSPTQADESYAWTWEEHFDALVRYTDGPGGGDPNRPRGHVLKARGRHPASVEEAGRATLDPARVERLERLGVRWGPHGSDSPDVDVARENATQAPVAQEGSIGSSGDHNAVGADADADAGEAAVDGTRDGDAPGVRGAHGKMSSDRQIVARLEWFVHRAVESKGSELCRTE